MKKNIALIHGFITQMFIILMLVLLTVSRSMTKKCVYKNNRPCMVRPMLIDLNTDELHYYPFVRHGSCNIFEYLFGKIYVDSKSKI